MAKLRELSQYLPFTLHRERELDIRIVERLHRKVGDLRDRFTEEPPLQDYLLNSGRELDDEDRPTSFLSVEDSTIPRSRTMIHLGYLRQAIELATAQPIYIEHVQRIILPGESPRTDLTTPDGLNCSDLEAFQTSWMLETGVRETARRFERTLSAAMDEFNLKFMLNSVRNASRFYIPPEEVWDEIRAIREETTAVWSHDAYLALDSAYYNMAGRISQTAGTDWSTLQESDFGRKFTLTIEQERQILRESRRAAAQARLAADETTSAPIS